MGTLLALYGIKDEGLGRMIAGLAGLALLARAATNVDIRLLAPSAARKAA